MYSWRNITIWFLHLRSLFPFGFYHEMKEELDALVSNWIHVHICLLSCICFFETPWTIALQIPLFIEFSRQEYWSGLPFPVLGNLPNPGIEPRSPALQADSLLSDPLGKPLSDLYLIIIQEWKWSWPAWAGRSIHKVRFFFPQCHAQRHIPLLHHFISFHITPLTEPCYCHCKNEKMEP